MSLCIRLRTESVTNKGDAGNQNAADNIPESVFVEKKVGCAITIIRSSLLRLTLTMLRGALSAFYAIVSRREVGDFEFSALSGIVGRGKVSGQNQVSLALDFTQSTNSFMYLDGPVCPEYLRCFRSSNPEWEFMDMEVNIPPFSQTIPSRLISSPFLEEYNEEWRRRLMRFRDVHGVISAGPNSELFSCGRVMALHEVMNESPRSRIEFMAISGSVDQPNTVIVDIIEGSERWEFLATDFTITNDGRLLSNSRVRILIDPGFPGVAIPSSIFGQDLLEIGLQGLPSMSFTVGSQVIRISSEQFEVPDDPRHIRMFHRSHEGETITIGRPLIRSLHRLFLDGERRRIGFRLLESPLSLGPIHFQRGPRSPFFKEPDFHETKVNIQTGSDGYIYVGRFGRPGKKCWVFARSDFALLGLIDLDYAIPRLTQHINKPRGRLDRDRIGGWGLVFRYVEDPEGLAEGFEVVFFPGRYEICETERRELDLPPPVVVPRSATDDEECKNCIKTISDEECRICFNEYLEGDSIQQIHGCPHTYHQHCLMRWLETAPVKKCPTCNGAINFRPPQTG